MKNIKWLLLIFCFVFMQINTVTASPQNSGQMSLKREQTINLSAAEKNQLDKFFSNIARANLKPFTNGYISDKKLIEFALNTIAVNEPRIVKVPVRRVNSICNKYFAHIPKKHGRTGDYKYADNFYFIPQASGEAFRFAQVIKLKDAGNGQYKAVVNIFTASSGFTGDVHGTRADWQAAGEDVELTDKMQAVLKKITVGKHSRYILLDYIKL
ncbi:hypothetical protein [Pectinatus brassicae]|uniref:Uncharacterized protein n=1 Tax=Pectinatus brassicae TaxID=862415 RepID=A0A840URZ3_9FIRM|nr:hypothetical protein [Pectinatus brassicae]MBB5337518.1 hypothetical protein [Pectinatus brassicae]